MSASTNPHRARLARRLRDLRAATGYSGNRFAERLGWLQSRVSKIETGKQLPTDDDLDAWMKAVGAAPAEADHVRELLAAARVEHVTWRELARRSGQGPADRQEEYRQREAAASFLAEYHPAMIPGLLQTPEYARAMLRLPGGPPTSGIGEGEIEAIVATRMRRQEILYQPGRQLHFVMGEAALLQGPGAAETMLAQLDRLESIAGLRGVDVRVVPLGVSLPVMPVGGFEIEDDLVTVESMGGEDEVAGPAEVLVFRQVLDVLLDVTDPGRTLPLIRGAAATLRAACGR